MQQNLDHVSLVLQGFSLKESCNFSIFSFWALPAAPDLKLGRLALFCALSQLRATRGRGTSIVPAKLEKVEFFSSSLLTFSCGVVWRRSFAAAFSDPCRH